MNQSSHTNHTHSPHFRTNNHWVSINHIHEYNIKKSYLYVIATQSYKQNASSIFMNKHRGRLIVNIAYIYKAKQYQRDRIDYAHDLFYRITDITTINKFKLHIEPLSKRSLFSWNNFITYNLFSSALGRPESLVAYQMPEMLKEFITLAEIYLNHIARNKDK